jgi:nicotinamidase/pyrazinamidase
MAFTPAPGDALIVVDVQRDFCPGGSLAVPDGDQVVPVINRLAPRFGTVVTTHDTHPADHSSFVEQGGPWPPHCVEGTPGFEPHPDLRVRADFQVFKGRERELDGYTGWTPELADFLVKRGVRRVVAAGLALDYCVKATALDARAAGFAVVLLTDATRAVNVAPDDGDRALDALRAAGVREDRAEEATRPATA